MLLYRLKRLMAEREVLIGLGILGFTVMLADLLDDLALSLVAAIIRGFGLSLLVLLLVWELWLRSRFRKPVAVPVMFTEETDRARARSMFERFVQSANLSNAVKVMESVSPLQRDDLLIRLNHPNPRNSSDPSVWKAAWSELLWEWEREVDKKLVGQPFTSEGGRCYHVFPHIVLPLAFALGASVDLRRSVVLYHRDDRDRFYRVLDLSASRSLYQADPAISHPQSTPQDLSALPQTDKLILHLIISDRHPFQPDKHPDHAQAASAALVYKQALNPESDWLPYVQWLWQKASPLIAQYKKVDMCLICSSVVAFALGMAFSRMPHITVCHWLNNQYQPVFSLEEVEGRLPFD